MAYDKEQRRAEYAAKLRDPRWQKKRLEIMQRDEFTCQKCCDTTTTLNVHHNYYEPNTEPWDYPDSALVTFCEICHQEETDMRRQEEAYLLDVCRRLGMTASCLNGLMIALHDIGEFSYFSEPWEMDLTWMLKHFWELREIIKPLIDADRKARAQRTRERMNEIEAASRRGEDAN